MNNDFYKGQPVVFGRPNGEQTRGTVIKVNRRTVQVQQDEGRGVHKAHAVGTKWKVAKSLCRPADDSEAPKARAKRPEAEIMDDILMVYGQLSPENLSCDGELPRRLVQRRYADLQRQLRALETEMGRKVTEGEAYSWAVTSRNAS